MRFMVQFSIPTEYGNEVVRSGKIEKVFKITGLNKILAIFPDTASATAAFKKKGFFGR